VFGGDEFEPWLICLLSWLISSWFVSFPQSKCLDCCLQIHVHWSFYHQCYGPLKVISQDNGLTQSDHIQLTALYMWIKFCLPVGDMVSFRAVWLWLAYIHRGGFQTVYHSETNYLVGVTPNWIAYAVLHFHFLPNNKMLWHKMTVMWHLCMWLRLSQHCLSPGMWP
jgi:hypothetical protein